MLDSDRESERHKRARRVLELTADAGIVHMSLDIKLRVLGMTTGCRVLELVWSWAHSADVLGGCGTVEAGPLVCGESEGVDRLYMGKKV